MSLPGMRKPPVSELVDQNSLITMTRGFFMLFYRAALPLSSRTLNYTAGIIRRHLRAIGSRWRKLNPGQQALLVLAYLRKGETFAQLAAGFGIGRTTAWRYVSETVELLAARAPKLRQAVRDATKAGWAYAILDGTLIPIDRVAADRPFYSGKHKKHGMNLQVIASPDGDILWVSGALPGSVHDKKAKWISRPGNPQQAPLLPLARRETRQGHPHIAAPRSLTRLERLSKSANSASPTSVIQPSQRAACKGGFSYYKFL